MRECVSGTSKAWDSRPMRETWKVWSRVQQSEKFCSKMKISSTGANSGNWNRFIIMSRDLDDFRQMDWVLLADRISWSVVFKIDNTRIVHCLRIYDEFLPEFRDCRIQRFISQRSHQNPPQRVKCHSPLVCFTRCRLTPTVHTFAKTVMFSLCLFVCLLAGLRKNYST